MARISGSATGVGRQSTLAVKKRGENVTFKLSGTYAMTIVLEKERGSPGSGAFETVLGPFSTANATVEELYTTKDDNERLVMNVTSDTSGTVVFSYGDGDQDLDVRRDKAGDVFETTKDSGKTLENNLVVKGEFDNRDMFMIFDDFLYQTIVEADTPWIENSGADAQALDPVIAATEEGGVITLTTGNADGTVANDGSQIICSVPMQADSGKLFFECRLHIDTAVTDISVNAGFTDVTTLEEPVSLSGTTFTTVASNAVVFVYDTASTDDLWHAAGVDGDTDATGNGTTGTGPTADTYQVLRIEISSDGEQASFYIDGTLVKELDASVVAASTNLFATVIANATTTTSKTVDIDYIACGHTR